ncbi:MAG: phosphopyruvate hydratase [Candidatus Heimdallarchaeota archaeon]|nr:phosphopyruvate hydratase [Candidatus Heimdallarchaeota archaeon]
MINKIIAREVFDSRGNPTIEVEIQTKNGQKARAIVPSGASTGAHEALELRDEDKSRFLGKGVLKAISNVQDIIFPKIEGCDVRNIHILDDIMLNLDVTKRKLNLGANAILSVSLACSKLAAKVEGIPLYDKLFQLAYNKKAKKYQLPVPMANVINGGKHAGGKLAPQEFMIMPLGFKDLREAMRSISEIYAHLKIILKNKYGPAATNVGDEGGFGSPVDKSKDALDLLVIATEQAQYELGKEIYFALDPAASEFYRNENYYIDGETLNEGELVDYWYDLIQTYPIVSIEDPFNEDSFEGFAEFRKKVADKIQVVGDDLTVTSTERLQMAIDKRSINSLLLKINQIGSITESIAAAKLCWENNYSIVVSHRSGETEDTSIADLTVGLCNGQIKTGAIARGERTAKYNQLLRISEELGNKAIYAGQKFRTGFKEFI